MMACGGSRLLRLLRALLLGAWLLPWVGLQAATLELGPADRLRVDAAVSWCATAPEQSIDSVAAGACTPQPLRAGDLHQGFDRRAFWLRLELANPEPEPQQRWLEVGHMRLTEVALFAPQPAGWQRSAIGMGVPLAQRDLVGRRYGLLALTLPPHGREVFWLRVVAESRVDLTPTLWQPEAYREQLRQSELSQALGLGGLLPAIFLSLLLFAIMRQQMFLFFALGITGALLADGVQSGLLQRYVWPRDWPLPVQVLSLAYMVAIAAFVAWLHAAVPGLVRFRIAQRLWLACTLLAVLALLYASAVDFGVAIPLASLLMVSTLLLGCWLMLRTWRAGSRPAGFLFVALALLIVLSLLRLADFGGLIRSGSVLTQVLKFVLLLITQAFLAGMLVRSRELRAELAVAQAESEARVAFLAQMSHELRAPLDTVLGNAQLIARAAPPPAIVSRVAAVTDSGRQLLRLVDDVLDYARGQAGGLRIEPVPVALDGFLRGVERNARLLAARQGNRFELQLKSEGGTAPALAGLALRLDPGRLRQVLDNLLANAARHTRDGEISLELALRPLVGEHLRLEFALRDSGEGIAPADQPHIFEPFERAGYRERQGRQGAGLGLAISRQLVELMGGRIAVESQPGQGACFRFWIDTVAETAGAGRDRSTVEAFEAVGYAGYRRWLLLVDDDLANRAILAALLRELGFDVSEVGSVAAGTELLASAEVPDLVLTDQYLPDGEGWQLLERLAELRPGVPALMISAAPSTPPSPQAAALCAAHFLRPLDHAALLGAIGDLLGLQWLSAAEEASSDANGCERPDAAALDELARWVDGGQLTEIIEWAQALKANSPPLCEFADRVLAAVDAIDFPALEVLAAQPAPDQSDQPDQAGRKPSTDR